MRQLRRLAILGLASIALGALPAAAAVYYYFSQSHAVAFLYGVGVGAVAFASIAVSVALLTGQRSGLRMMLGALVYVGRLGFAAAAVAIPVSLGYWSALPIVCGLAGVYVIENVTVLVALGTAKGDGSRQQRGEGSKRRVEV